ncbi:MAG: TIGR01244 family sulfur transferase [Telluria sp.]
MKFSFKTLASALVLSASALAAAAGPTSIAPGVAVAGQLREADLSGLKAQGYTTIVDQRPDGEAADQPSSALMAAAARAQGLRFSYIPVRPGAIPDTAVEELRAALAANPQGVLIYCRSGSRAARTWGLAEAARPDGPDAATILAAIRAAGQSGDDLAEALAQRIAGRPR